MDQLLVQQISKILLEAENSKKPINPLTESYKDLEVRDAYQVQQFSLNQKKLNGEKLVGRKLGLTSKAMQDQLRVYEPDFGFLTNIMILDNEAHLRRTEFIQPRVEGELAFLLGRELKGPGVTTTTALLAVDRMLPAIEIIDSRIIDWRIKIQDTIADNASSSRVVLGEVVSDPKLADIKHLGMVFQKNGEIASTATPAAVMGHPARALAWLANKLSDFGEELGTGDIVMTGALAPSLQVHEDEGFTASFGKYGEVSVTFR